MTATAETRTVHDPVLGKDVQVSDNLTDRLRGRYASGPHLPNGNPEFGWRQFQAPPIQHEAAAVIESLSISSATLKDRIHDLEAALQIAQEMFSIVVNPQDHPNTSVLHLWAQCKEIECKIRDLLQPKDSAK
jgi:hypothetical protein